MYRRIMIPVAGPTEVEPLIRQAAELLDPDGEIRVVHIIPNRSLPEMTRAWRSATNIVVPAHETGAALDIRVEPEIKSASGVTSGILDAAEGSEVDAILLTLGDDRRARSPLMGHTSTALLQHATCDVIIVNRLALLDRNPKKILLPSFSDAPQPKAEEVAHQLSLRHGGCPVVSFRVWEAEAAAAGQSRVRVRVFGRRRDLVGAVVAKVEKEFAGLLLLVDDGHQPGGPLLTRTFLEDLFQRAPAPVMALRLASSGSSGDVRFE
ncbi:MAG TPA: universal stress protein [Thermoplasmata archaeon]|nr:universal stress protein [Thermoplasmata archaeon]